MIKTVGVITLH